ncbi:MAG TPA: CocE/NonD family hydrolase [Candidatus Hydrogenedentes bacterium]|nr:CocE/NonD family hydrolase [Candidatus Hydrogenedentota bacterium]
MLLLRCLLGGSAAAFEIDRPACVATATVPMIDGVKLATDCYLPSPEGSFPVVLMRMVYDKANPLVEPIAKEFLTRGIAFVVQDTRGRFASEGEDTVFGDDGWEPGRGDGAHTVEWLKGQPWCNGTVGSCGWSAVGITQMLLAGATTSVACQTIGVAASKMYGQMAYQGGVFRKALCETWLQGQGNAHYIDIWKSHPCCDTFWQRLDGETRAPHITAPATHMGGWWDILQEGAINGFITRQERGGPGARGNQKLVVGPWTHARTKEAGEFVLPDNFDFDVADYEKRFIDYWLKGERNGIMDEPVVHYYTIGDLEDPDAPGNEWRTADAWPPFPTDETPFYLAGEGLLTKEPPGHPTAKARFAYDPADPCPTRGGQNLAIPGGPFDQREVSSRPDVLKFSTAPLEAAVEITGNVRVKLYVSSDAPDTDFTAKLVDVYPDGREVLMLDNILRVKFRNGFEKPDTLPPGKIGVLDIDLWHISLIVNAGHRIGLHVSSSNYPRFEKNPNTGDDLPTDDNLRVAHNVVHMGKECPSTLILPVRPA